MSGVRISARSLRSRVPALRDRDRAEVLRRSRRSCRMYARANIANCCGGVAYPYGHLVLELELVGRRPPGAAHAELRARVHRPPAHDALGLPGGDRHRGRADDRVRRAAAAELVEEEVQVVHAERLGDDRRRRGVADPVARHAVDVGEREAGVVERGADRPQRQRERAHARVLRVRRRADADDRGLVAERTSASRLLGAQPTRIGDGGAAIAAVGERREPEVGGCAAASSCRRRRPGAKSRLRSTTASRASPSGTAARSASWATSWRDAFGSVAVVGGDVHVHEHVGIRLVAQQRHEHVRSASTGAAGPNGISSGFATDVPAPRPMARSIARTSGVVGLERRARRGRTRPWPAPTRHRRRR